VPELLKTTGFYYFMQNLPKRIPKRIVLYAKDVENITGKSRHPSQSCISVRRMGVYELCIRSVWGVYQLCMGRVWGEYEESMRRVWGEYGESMRRV
jgi:hypothetical protein